MGGRRWRRDGGKGCHAYGDHVSRSKSVPLGDHAVLWGEGGVGGEVGGRWKYPVYRVHTYCYHHSRFGEKEQPESAVGGIGERVRLMNTPRVTRVS